MGVGPGSLTPGVQSVYWVGSVEVEDDGEALVVEEDHHVRKRVRNIVVFPPLMCEDFKMSTAGEGKVRRFSQGSRDKIIQNHLKNVPRFAIGHVLCDWFRRSRVQKVGPLKGRRSCGTLWYGPRHHEEQHGPREECIDWRSGQRRCRVQQPWREAETRAVDV